MRQRFIKGDDHSLILLQTNLDDNEVLINYLRDGDIQEITDQAQQTVADRNLIDAAKECERFVERWNAETNENISRLVSVLRYSIYFIFYVLEDESSVYRVFEVLNSRGLEVKWIDKLKSQLMALIFQLGNGNNDGEALRELKKVWMDIYKTSGFRGGLGDEALRFAGTIMKTAQPSKLLNEEGAVEELIKVADDGTVQSIINVAKGLRSMVIAVDKLDKDNRLSAVTTIIHARFVGVTILLNKDFTEEQKQELSSLWEHITFLVFGLSRADTRFRVGAYVRLGYNIYRYSNVDDNFNRIKRELEDIGIDFNIDDAVNAIKTGKHRDCYTGWKTELRYLLYRYDEHLAKSAGENLNKEQWIKVWTDTPSTTIEHITPQSSNVDYIHNLGNLVMLAPKVNSSLGSQDPIEKAETYRECGIKETVRVGKRIHKNQKWDESHVDKRTDRIIRFIKEIWG